MNIKTNILSEDILATPSLRLTYTTRGDGSTQVGFNPGEELNELLGRMPAVLNPVRAPQTCTVPPHSDTWHREFRSSALMKVVFWSSILPVPAQQSHSPNPQIPTPSHNQHLMLLCSRVWQHHLSSFPPCCLLELCTCSVRQCHSWVAAQHLQQRDPTQLSCADFDAFCSPQPFSTSTLLIRGCCQTTMAGTVFCDVKLL